MLRLTQVLRYGAAISAVLGVSLLADCALAQRSPPGGNSWATPDLQAASIEFSLLQQYDDLGTAGSRR